jgi:Protein of unknown function (DUF3987)
MRRRFHHTSVATLETPDPDQQDRGRSFDPYYLPFTATPIEYPIAALPTGMKMAVEDMMRATGSHISYVSTVAIVTALGLVGSRSSIQVGPQHVQPCSLFGLLVGGTRSGKSAAMRPAIELLADISESENSIELPDFNDPVVKMTMEVMKQVYKKQLKQAIEYNMVPPDMPPVLRAYIGGAGDEPLLLTDGSAEGLEKAAKRSHHGIILIIDELAKFFGGPRGASVQQFLFTAFDTSLQRKSLVSTDEPSAKPVIASLIGGTTPRSVDKLGLDSGRGLAGRSLVAFEQHPPLRELAIDGFNGQLMLNKLGAVRNKSLPHVFCLNNAAWRRISTVSAQIRERSLYGPSVEADAAAGVDALLIRLSAAIHILSSSTPSDVITEASARCACRLYNEYYLPSLIHAVKQTDDTLRKVILEIAGFVLIKSKSDRINRRMLHRATGIDRRGYKWDFIEDEMIVNNIAIVENTTSGPDGGRPAKFLVFNPDYAAAFRRMA